MQPPLGGQRRGQSSSSNEKTEGSKNYEKQYSLFNEYQLHPKKKDTNTSSSV
jgi:hypothetical protein